MSEKYVCYEVRCWNQGKIVRTLHFWEKYKVDKFIVCNKDNYDRIVVQEKIL